MNVEYFYRDIVSQFSTSFDMSKIRSRLPDSVNLQQVTPESLLRLNIENEEMVQFEGGVIRLEGLARVTKIERMGFGREQVSAVVAGSTDEAMLLCKTLCLALWKAAGIQRRWEDLASRADRVRYKTSTEVELPFTLMEMLSPAVRAFLADDVGGGSGKFMGMRPTSAQRREQQSNEIEVVSFCREIELKVVTFNRVTGVSEDNTLDFMIKARSDANRHAVYVSSELPTDEHIALTERLIASARNS